MRCKGSFISGKYLNIFYAMNLKDIYFKLKYTLQIRFYPKEKFNISHVKLLLTLQNIVILSNI
jgi:hypothetical protein